MYKGKDLEEVFSGGEVSGPAKLEDIESAQNELGVVFPKEYRDFLEEFGAALASGFEIYGLPSAHSNSPPLWQNVVTVTKELRNLGQVGAEQAALIPISENGDGVYFFIDTRESPKTKIWAIGPGVEEVVSTSFIDFVVGFSRDELKF